MEQNCEKNHTTKILKYVNTSNNENPTYTDTLKRMDLQKILDGNLYDDGYNVGYDTGYERGHEEGYEEGFDEGLAEGSYQ